MHPPRRTLRLPAGLAVPVLALTALASTPSASTPAAATPGAPYADTTISLISRATGSAQGNGASLPPALSASGRYVAFASVATNLAPGDDGGMDVFVRDRLANRTTRVSVGLGGAQPNGDSYDPEITPDGRYVAFASWASNLVPGDTNGVGDVYVRDLITRTTTRVSVTSTGGQGQFNSGWPRITADGRQVAFVSDAVLAPADTTPMVEDVYVHNLDTRRTSLVSIPLRQSTAERGAHQADISADGRFVTFTSASPNLAPRPSGFEQVFIRDRKLGTTRSVATAVSGVVPDHYTREGRISGNGRYVAFTSAASNILPGVKKLAEDVVVADLAAGTLTLASVNSAEVQANFHSWSPRISDSGRFVAFVSQANNLAPGDRSTVFDVFVRDRVAGTTHRVSTSPDAGDANDASHPGEFSADGRHLGFASEASNLVRGDGNGRSDAFVRDTFGDLR